MMSMIKAAWSLLRRRLPAGVARALRITPHMPDAQDDLDAALARGDTAAVMQHVARMHISVLVTLATAAADKGSVSLFRLLLLQICHKRMKVPASVRTTAIPLSLATVDRMRDDVAGLARRRRARAGGPPHPEDRHAALIERRYRTVISAVHLGRVE